jgi:hypothetical protein
MMMVGVLLGSLIHLGHEQPAGLLLICLMLIVCGVSEWLIGCGKHLPPRKSSMEE